MSLTPNSQPLPSTPAPSSSVTSPPPLIVSPQPKSLQRSILISPASAPALSSPAHTSDTGSVSSDGMTPREVETGSSTAVPSSSVSPLAKPIIIPPSKSHLASVAAAKKNSISSASTRRNKLHGASRRFEQDYTLLTDCLLGSGASGKVYVCTSRRNPTHEYAVKVIKLDQNQIDLEKFQEEMKILSTIRHRHIVRLKDVYTTPSEIYIVTQLAFGGELFDRILQVHSFAERDCVNIARSLFQAVAYLHSRGIIHRDIKPENILFATPDANSDILLTDFGFARDLMKPSRNLRAKTQTGSYGFQAPEIFTGRPYDEKADVYSLGVVCYIMLCGLPPYVTPADVHNGAQPFWIYTNAMISGATKPVEFPDELGWKDISAAAKHFLAGVLELEPAKRLRSIDALNHPWLRRKKGVHAHNASNIPLAGGPTKHNILQTHQQLNRYLTFTLNKKFDLAKLKAEQPVASDDISLPDSTRQYSDVPASPSGTHDAALDEEHPDDLRLHCQSSTPTLSNLAPPLMARSSSHDLQGPSSSSASPSASRMRTPSASVSTLQRGGGGLDSAPPSANFTRQNTEDSLAAYAALAVSPITPNLAHPLGQPTYHQVSYSFEPVPALAVPAPLPAPTHARDASSSSATTSDADSSHSGSSQGPPGYAAAHSRDSSTASTGSACLARKAKVQHYATLPAQYTVDLEEGDEDEDQGEFEPEFHSSEDEHGAHAAAVPATTPR